MRLLAARDLPLGVPGLVLLQELRQARMHRNVRIGVDSLHLHADEVLRHRRESRLALREIVLVLVERGDHLVDHVLRNVRSRVVAEQNTHAQ